MSAGLPPGLTAAAVFLVLIVLVVARRTYRQIYGAPYSTGRLFVFAGFYVLLFGFLAFGTLYAAVALWGPDAFLLLVAYGAVPTAAAVLAAPYVERVVRFERRPNGAWYYRLSWHVPVLYLGLFITRIAAEIAIFGLSAVLISFPPPAPPSMAALAILMGVDLLFGLSLGLLVGRGVGVYRAYERLSFSRSESLP
jgi:hypothetical protein